MDRVILLKVYFILLLVKIDISIDYHETDNIKGFFKSIANNMQI